MMQEQDYFARKSAAVEMLRISETTRHTRDNPVLTVDTNTSETIAQHLADSAITVVNSITSNQCVDSKNTRRSQCLR